MIDGMEPIIVEFPLRGEWMAPQTPGTRIPSHGTDRLGTRYAYDFIQVDWSRKGLPSYKAHPIHYLTLGIPLEEYYCWGQDIYAPCDGVVEKAEDGYKERSRTYLPRDLMNARKFAHSFDPSKHNLQLVAGNYVIIKCAEHIFAAFVHMKTGSVQVKVGQAVKKGEVLGKVGHSGNSLGPHLHFQLMDSGDMKIANGLPCVFEQYEKYQDGTWTKVYHGIPTDKDRIRFL